MGLLRDTHKVLQRKLLVSDLGMQHGTCVTHVPWWCMSGSLTRGGGENVISISGACATCNFTYLARGPLFLGAARNGAVQQLLALRPCLIRPKLNPVSKFVAFVYARFSKTESGFVNPWNQPRRRIHWIQDGGRWWGKCQWKLPTICLSNSQSTIWQ